MAIINSVRMAKFDFKDSQFTTFLAAGITAADQGKAMTYDNTGDNKLKLAADQDPICACLYTVENRVNEGTLVGTSEFRFATYFPIKAGLAGNQVVARGKKLIGAGAGEVRAADPAVAADMVAVNQHSVHCWGLWTLNGVTYAIATQI